MLSARCAVEIRGAHRLGLHFSISCWLWAASLMGQQIPDIPEVPSQFSLDMEMAARLRPQLLAQSTDSGERYSVGRLALDRLVKQLAPESHSHGWMLRIVRGDDLNAFSSPDGTIYVAAGLANMAGQSAGLWAAILSHEVAHVVRRDWARRYQ